MFIMRRIGLEFRRWNLEVRKIERVIELLLSIAWKSVENNLTIFLYRGAFRSFNNEKQWGEDAEKGGEGDAEKGDGIGKGLCDGADTNSRGSGEK